MARQFEKLSEDVKQAVSGEWKQGEKLKAIEMAKILIQSPDAGNIGVSTLIEDADRDRRME